MDTLSSASSATTVATPAAKRSATRRQIRGSSLLLMGRFLSKGVNFVVQVLIVRYLTKSDYGAFAYALSIVTLGETIVTFGLDRAVTRFVPIYHERGEHDKMLGTLLMVMGTIVTLGLALILALYGFQHQIARSFINDELAFTLLLTMIFLSPIRAFDTVLTGLLAVFSSPRAIFFRKYVLGPGLKLGIVVLLIARRSDVSFLAEGYVVAGVLGIATYALILWRLLKREGLLQLRNVTIPALEVLTFTVPLLTSDLVYTVMNTVDAVLLERFQGTVDVAALRAVQPTAKLNQLVLSSFALLFTPLAARLFAREDREAVNDLYWQNAAWTAVASFPVFVLTFSLAKPITVLLYGTRYEESAIILALLSSGYYFNAALGQNGLTLKVYGKVRYVVFINVFVAVLNLALNLLLIPRYGALGAAVGTFTTMVIFNLLKQAGLAMGTGIRLWEPRYMRVYLSIVAGAVGLLFLQWLANLPAYVSIGLAGVISVLIVRLNRTTLRVDEMFPELLRIPFVRHIIGA